MCVWMQQKKMAAEVETHPNFCKNDNNICSSYYNLAEELSAVLNHGSISLGKYGGDSCAWEKRSVFANNRCQEELDKFMAPGLVAQKKAFFERYYRFVSSMNALPTAHQREKATLLGNGVDAAAAKKEEKLSNASQNDQTKTLHMKPNNSKQGCKQVKCCYGGSNGNGAMRLAGNSKCAEQKTSFASGKVPGVDNMEKHGTILKKNKGTLASAIDKVKVCSKITREADVKSKLKPFIHQRVDKTVPPVKQCICRKITEPNSSFLRKADDQVIKPCSNSRTKLEKVPNVKVTKVKTSSASRCCTRKTETKSSSNSQHSRNKTEAKLPVISRFYKSISKIISRPNCLRNMAYGRRKSSERSSHRMRPEVEESADQRPKVIFKSLLAREISNHNIGVEHTRNRNKELKQKEGHDKIHVGLKGGAAKHSSTLSSCTKRASVQQLISRKIVPLESAKLKCNLAEQRQKRPIWR